MGLSKHTGWEKSNENELTSLKTNLKAIIWLLIQKINKHTVPNKSVQVGKILQINKHTAYVYLDP